MRVRISREHGFAGALCTGLAAASFACATAGTGGGGAQPQGARATPAGLQKSPQVTHNGLQQVQGVFEHEFVKPGTSLAGYRRILLDPVGLAYTKGDTPQRKIAPQDFEQMRAIFQEEVGKQLASGGYQLATTPGPDVLRVQAEAVDLKLNPPQFGDPNSTDYALTSESAIVVATLRDSESGEILARVAQPEQPGAGQMEISDPFGFWSQIRELFRRWAVLLLQMVEEARHR